MKIFIMVVVALCLSGIVTAADKWQVGTRFGAANLISVSDPLARKFAKQHMEFRGEFTPELYTEYRLMSWLGAELGAQYDNALVHSEENTTNNYYPGITPNALLKAHWSGSWFDVAFGLGAQIGRGQSSKESFKSQQSVDNYGFDSGCSCIMYLGTTTVDVETQVSVQGAGISPLVQLDSNFAVWKALVLGVNIKYTPMATTTVDLKNAKTYVNGVYSPGISLGNEPLTITRMLGLGVNLAYSF